jgi:hypothetical protein
LWLVSLSSPNAHPFPGAPPRHLFPQVLICRATTDHIPLHSKTFFFFFAVNLGLAAFVLFLVPETRNIVLEEMDTLFGGPNHVEKGGAQLHIEDTHHAHAGDNEIRDANEDIASAGRGNDKVAAQHNEVKEVTARDEEASPAPVNKL